MLILLLVMVLLLLLQSANMLRMLVCYCTCTCTCIAYLYLVSPGVHSGDATLVLPAQDLNKETVHKIRTITESIARALSVSGKCYYHKPCTLSSLFLSPSLPPLLPSLLPSLPPPPPSLPSLSLYRSIQYPVDS